MLGRWISWGVLLSSLFGWVERASGNPIHVDAGRPDDTGDGLTWGTAKRTLQAAVDAAPDQGLVLVAPGVYDDGVGISSGTNRVVVARGITVRGTGALRSDVVIKGAGAGTPGHPTDTDIRCAVLLESARLENLTLRDGRAVYTSDSWSQPVTASGGGVLMDVSCIVSNCWVVSNQADLGGGVCAVDFGLESETNATQIVASLVEANTAGRGGGIADANVLMCNIENNVAVEVWERQLHGEGGGMSGGSAKRSKICGNSGVWGSGVAGGALLHCLVSGNNAKYTGAVSQSAITNCTIIANAADVESAGVYRSDVKGSIVYYNYTNGHHDNDLWGKFEHSCVWPARSGAGNFDSPPKIVSINNPVLFPDSPCVDASGVEFAPGELDIGGNLRITGGGADMGAFELPVSHDDVLDGLVISNRYNRVAIGFGWKAEIDIRGHPYELNWDFGDGASERNRHSAVHAYDQPGQYTVVVKAATLSGTLAATTMVEVVEAPVHYADLAGANIFPYTSPEAAATNINDAVEATEIPGSVVVVAPGVYDSGSRFVYGSNRVALVKPVVLRGVPGRPQDVVIRGEKSGHEGFGQGVRGVYVGEDAVVDWITVTNARASGTFDFFAIEGYESGNGGGFHCRPGAIVQNSVVTDCAAERDGAGMYRGTARDVVFSGFRASTNSQNKAVVSAANILRCIFNNNNHLNYIADGCSLDSCIVLSNQVGRIAFDSVLSSSLIVNNTGHGITEGGSIVDGINARALVSRCTIAGNVASASVDGGAGAFLSSLVENSIVCGVTNLNYQYGPDLYSNNVYTNSLIYASAFEAGFRRYVEVMGVPAPDNDYRPAPWSPSINSGINEAGMADETDLAGNPRIGNGRVDIGAYEFYFDTGIRAKLEGPFSPGSGMMTRNPAIPLASPYAPDPRIVASIPTNAVDWALLELRTATNSAPVYARSVFLREDGQAMTETGATVIPVDVAPMTNYFVTVKHRNHLASTSAAAMAFTNAVVDVDFTSGFEKYLGGTNVAVQVGADWVARIGDLDGDGVISALDEAIFTTQTGGTGYLRGDVNFDGQVDVADLVFTNNLARGQAGNFMSTVLSPNLRLLPDRKTLVSGEQLPLSISEAGHTTIHWAYAANPSGSTLFSSTGPAVTYTAGPTPGVVDVVQAWDASNRVGRTYLNVISPSEVAALGKAIVLAGGRSHDDPVWPATEYLAEKAYGILRYRGYSRENLQYLTFQPGVKDLDGDGVANDIDGGCTLATAQHAFTTFAAGANALVVYLVDHGSTSGGLGRFRLNGSELLEAATVDGWLDAFQDASGKDVIVVLDFCYAGAFAAQLDYTGVPRRTVLSATQPGQLTYFIAGGQVSFSEYFWNGVLQGLNVKDAFELGRAAMNAYQQGFLEDRAGGAVAQTQRIGASFIAGKDFPVISRFLDGQALTGTSRATLWVESIASTYELERVWCTITPPNYSVDSGTGQPVLDIPVRDLSFNPVTQRWEFDFEGFTQQGPYLVNFFARDVWGSVSPPRTTTIFQRGFDERLILVAAGDPADPDWPNIKAAAHQALAAYGKRLLGTNEVYFLSAEAFDDFDHPGTNIVDAVSSAAALNVAVRSWAAEADKLTVHLIGSAGSDNRLRLGSTETLDPQSLSSMLGSFQQQTEQVVVVLDHDGSGASLYALRPPSGKERVIIASAEAGRPALRKTDLNFTSLFTTGILQGQTVGASVDRARKTLRRSSGNLRQKGLLDDNGNGIPNEKDLDGLIADERYIGSAFVTGEDNPVISGVMPETVLTNSTAALLWAEGVTDADGIQAAWVDVTAPTNWVGAVNARVDLMLNPGNGRWEAAHGGFVAPGVYTLAFQAMDTQSNLSSIVQSRVLVEDAATTTRRNPHLPDPFEPDGLCEVAPIFDLPLIQTRSLHASNDCDAVLFFAQGDLVYDIETVHLTNTVDTVIEIHRVFTNGTTLLVDRIDEFGTEEGELGGLDYPDEGLYCVRVCHADGTPFAPGSYVLIIHVPAGFTGINITAWNRQTQQGMAGAIARLYDTGGNVLTNTTVGASGQVKFLWPRGSYRVEVVPPQGYLPDFDPQRSYNVPENAGSDYGNARSFGVDDFGTVSWGSGGGSSATYLGFAFFPAVAVTGSVVDEMTNVALGNAGFAAVQGSTGQGFNRYPWASYGALWRSTPGGSFPSTLYLPPSSAFSMLVGGLPGYVNRTVTFTTPTSAPLNLGRIKLPPVDSDNDGLPDAWETAMFGNLAQTAASNPDGDAFTTAQEFQAGTHPHQGGSELKLVEPTITGDTLTLTWPAVATRKYNIRSAATLDGDWTTEDLVSNPPVISGGTATWTTPAPPDRRYYQIETVFLP